MTKVKEEIHDSNYYKEIHFLYEILNSLKNVEEVKSFFKDILTRSELIMIKRRWHIAGFLYRGMDIRSVASQTHTGTHTVTRIKKVLEEGHGGLLTALKKAKEKEKQDTKKYMKSKSSFGGSTFVKGWFK